MKTVNYCVCCESKRIQKKLGYFQPFISNKVMDYPVSQINIGNSQPFFPILFTNSIKCLDCDFVFSQVRFEEEEMARIYTGYRNDAYTSLRTIFEPGYTELNKRLGKDPLEIKNRALALSQFLNSEIHLDKVNSILDYGGDEGQHIPDYFSNANKYVYDVSGVDVVEGVTKIDAAHQGTFDLVICSNVLEHLPYPVNALKDIEKWLHKDSLVFIDVPNEIAHLGDHPTVFHEHINYFTEPSVTALLEKQGYKIEKIQTVYIDFGWIQAKQIFVLASFGGAL